MDNTRRALSRPRAAEPDATVVIPAYNEERGIARALHAIARAVYITEHPTEVLVVANACTDDTAGIAERLGARVVQEERKGVSYARQRGLEESVSPVILSTDADTQVGSEWIDAHLRHYRDPEVVGVAGSHEYDSIHPSYRLYRLCARTIQLLSTALGKPPAPGYTGCNSSYRKSTVISFGGYEPGTNRGEDSLLGAKLRAFGDVVSDPSEEIRVLTSGRRFSALHLVMQEARRKIGLMKRGTLYTVLERGQDFEDIR